MISYRDMAFCPDRLCNNTECIRNHHWLQFNTEHLPVAYADFSKECDIRISKNKKEKPSEDA